MPAYMYQTSYSTESWKAQVGKSGNRLADVAKMVEGGGGKVVASYYAFGPSDVVLIAEWPSNKEAAAFAIAAAASGALKSLQTTPLMTAEEGAAAIAAAGSSTYSPPR